MINFKLEKGKFNYRIAGILIHDGKILLHKSIDSPRWSLPGGRAEMLEDSKETIIREFWEELQCEVEVRNMQFVVENFFVYKGMEYHEIGLIYHVVLKKGEIPNTAFTVVEDGITFYFDWFSLDELEQVPTHPEFLSKKLNTHLTPEIQHVIQK